MGDYTNFSCFIQGQGWVCFPPGSKTLFFLLQFRIIRVCCYKIHILVDHLFLPLSYKKLSNSFHLPYYDNIIVILFWNGTYFHFLSYKISCRCYLYYFRLFLNLLRLWHFFIFICKFLFQETFRLDTIFYNINKVFW